VVTDRPVQPEANAGDAALASKLMREAASATLAVVVDGQPYAAFTAPALGHDGAPLILASDFSAHGQALGGALADGEAASLLYSNAVKPKQPLKTARLTVQGTVLPPIDQDRAAYLAARPESALYIDFGDMKLFRLALTSAYLVAGFGRAVRLDLGMIKLSTGNP
jgi:heme iron utilization protein